MILNIALGVVLGVLFLCALFYGPLIILGLIAFVGNGIFETFDDIKRGIKKL